MKMTTNTREIDIKINMNMTQIDGIVKKELNAVDHLEMIEEGDDILILSRQVFNFYESIFEYIKIVLFYSTNVLLH